MFYRILYCVVFIPLHLLQFIFYIIFGIPLFVIHSLLCILTGVIVIPFAELLGYIIKGERYYYTRKINFLQWLKFENEYFEDITFWCAMLFVMCIPSLILSIIQDKGQFE